MSCEELCGMCSPSCTNYQEGQVLLEKDKLIQALERQLAEAREVIKKVEDLATSHYCQKNEYEDSVEIPYWDIVFALNIKEQG